MIVVVGGSGRKAGKTTVVCEIIAATREAGWTAIKITPHAHERGTYGDTERYLAAGAARAILTTELPQYSGNVVVESTSVLDILNPDVFVFVRGGAEEKASARKHRGKAHFVVTGHVTESVLNRVRQLLQ